MNSGKLPNKVLPEGQQEFIATKDGHSRDLLQKMLKQLQIMNIHLGEARGEVITVKDLET